MFLFSKDYLIVSLTLLFQAKSTVAPEPPDDMGRSILDALNGVCPATCKGDAIPAPKLGHLPYSGGCKTPDFSSLKGDYTDISHFQSCCNLNDICYMSCGLTKKFCDEDFKKCMLRECSFQLDEEECKVTANEMELGRRMGGCKWYQYSQQFLCGCYSPEESLERTSEYAHEFFTVYNKTHNLPSGLSQKYLEKTPNAERQGLLLFKLFKKYPDAIEIIGTDGTATRSFPKIFSSAQGDVPDDEDDNDEL